MPIKNKPFVSQTLEEERTDDIVNVRLNKKDREILDKFKELIGNEQDSTAIKLALFYANNVLQREFNGDIRVRLFKRRSQ